uniref:PID domain-containing protein n=1 Tax=Romanomermis culicivorax TaxID=13658 RepID=A0A915KHS1_ROMCU
MKPEMRCHAVLCKRLEQPANLAQSLQEKITAALMDYKREKLAKQNLRLSSASTAGYQPSVPRSIDEEFEEECIGEDAVNIDIAAAVASRHLTPYLADGRLSFDDGESSDVGGLTPSSSSDDASPDLPNRRRDSTFDFMRVVVDDENFNTTDFSKNKDRKFSLPDVVVETSTKNVVDDDDSISNESGYHEEKLSPIVGRQEDEGKICRFEDDYSIRKSAAGFDML